jgi:hypothetical protein
VQACGDMPREDLNFLCNHGLTSGLPGYETYENRFDFRKLGYFF